MTLPSPSQLLGVSGKDLWYPGQQAAFSRILNWYYGPSRFLGVSAPTGSGKSTLALLAAKVTGARTCILTATKGLQTQYLRDASPLGAVEVKGQNNFRCALVPSLTADEGPCHTGMSCSHSRSGGCDYRVQLKQALESQIVITNYAYYLAQTQYSSGLGDFGLLIADEGHQCFSALENYLTVYLDRMSVESLGLQFPALATSEVLFLATRTPKRPKNGPSPAGEGDSPHPPDLWAQWRSWASCAVSTAQNRADELAVEIKGMRDKGDPVPGTLSRAYRSAKAIAARLSSLSSASGGWIIQKAHHGMTFTPRWVADSGPALFQSVPKVAVMSAVLSPKTADSVGVPVESREWLDVPSYFPVRNAPIWHVPTARINYRTDDYGSVLWHARIDQIIQRRLDRKGIVFTVSYDRARLLLSRSRFKDIMLTHSTGDVSLVVERFKRAAPPKVLVSPTVTTGWDFPGDGKPQYVIVGKIPYPDSQDLVLKARHEDDKDWSAYLAMGTLVQECGRMTRSATDRAEVLIVDDNAKWFLWNYRRFAPAWFIARWRGSLSSVPDPLV